MKRLVEVGCTKISSFHNFITLDQNLRLDIIEPIPANLAEIKEFYKNNPNVFVHPYAIWNSPGKIKMHALGALSYVEGLSSPALYGFNYKPDDLRVIEVDAITFDQFDEGNIDWLDLDMEGAEIHVLEKMVSKPEIIVIENNDDQIKGWMAANRYEKFAYQEANTFYKLKQS